MKSNSLIGTIRTGIIVVLFVTMISCDAPITDKQSSESKQINSTQSEKTTPSSENSEDKKYWRTNKEGDDEYIVYTNTYLENIKKEDYTDPKSFDQPRIQFLGAFPKGSENDLIWSVKADGTDLRLVLDEKEIYADGWGVISNTPQRSPDNRYLAWFFRGGKEKAIVFDLKSRERIVLKERTDYFPNMAWKPDSKNLVIMLADLVEFNVATRKQIRIHPHDKKKLGEHIRFHDFRIHPQTGNVYITGINRKTGKNIVAVLNPDWSIKKEFNLYAGKNRFVISPDGKNLFSSKYGVSYFFNFDDKKKVNTFEAKGSIGRSFTPDSKNYYYSEIDYLEVHNIGNKVDDKICYIPFFIHHFLLLNY